jgi:hypothetical protein
MIVPSLMTCPRCHQQVQVPEELMDREVRCPRCRETFRADAPRPETAFSPLDRPWAGSTPTPEGIEEHDTGRGHRPSWQEEDWRSRESSSRYADVSRRLPATLPGNGLATATIVMLILDALLGVAMILQDQALLKLLERAPVPQVEADAHDARQLLLGGLRVLVFAVTVIFFCMWIYRAYDSLSLFGVQGLRFTPGWAVGYWFIPFVNLVRPVQVMQEIWRASSPQVPAEDPVAWQGERNSVAIGFYWFFYLVSSVVAMIAFRMQLDEMARVVPNLENLKKATVGVMVGEVLSIVAAVLLVAIILSIKGRQTRKFEQARFVESEVRDG